MKKKNIGLTTQLLKTQKDLERRLQGAEDRLSVYQRIVESNERKFNTLRTIAIDFDGVIHRYSKGWHDGSIYDGPMPGAMDSLYRLYKRGFNLVIFTARPKKGMLPWLQRHMDKEFSGLKFGRDFDITITNKKPRAFIYIDDRGLRFTNWVDMMNYLMG